MRGAAGRRRTLPAGNWPPYVQACLRKSLWFRAGALGVSAAGTIFFAVALWLSLDEEGLLGIGAVPATIAFVSQFGATIFLALDLLAARQEHRST